MWTLKNVDYLWRHTANSIFKELSPELSFFLSFLCKIKYQTTFIRNTEKKLQFLMVIQTTGLHFQFKHAAIDCPRLPVLLNTSSYTVNSFYEYRKKITCWLFIDMLYFLFQDQEFKCAPASLLGRDRVETGRSDATPAGISSLILLILDFYLTSPPVQLSLTFPDRKLGRKIHVWWYRV